MSIDLISSEAEENYVVRGLLSKLRGERLTEEDRYGPGSRNEYVPYMIGGSGWMYSQREIELMRQLADNGWTIVTGPCGKYSTTALHIAYYHNNQLMIDFLLEMGADPNVRNYRGKLPQEMRI